MLAVLFLIRLYGLILIPSAAYFNCMILLSFYHPIGYWTKNLMHSLVIGVIK